MELVCQLLPSPISIRLYDTYPETVKVSRERKDNGNGQTQGRRKRSGKGAKGRKDQQEAHCRAQAGRAPRRSEDNSGTEENQARFTETFTENRTHAQGAGSQGRQEPESCHRP
jgi:hypothetical protein